MSNNIIVPIHVSAMRVAQDHSNGDGQVTVSTADFTNISTKDKTISSEWLEGLIEGEKMLAQGVHLHWAMPRIFSRGNFDEEELIFPTLPNRWLVIRSYQNENPEQKEIHYDYDESKGEEIRKAIPDRAQTAWLIKSDILHDDESQGTTIIAPDEDDSLIMENKQVGKRYLLNVQQQYAYTAQGEEENQDLHAVSYHGTTFAAYYMNSGANLGLDDNLIDIYGNKQGRLDTRDFDQISCRLSYAVMGWHEQAEDDFFQKVIRPALEQLQPEQEDYQERLSTIFEKKCRISLSAGSYERLANGDKSNRLLCFGMIGQLDLSIKDKKREGYKMSQPNLEVSIGNSSKEALSAYFNHKAKSLSSEANIDPTIFEQSNHLELILNAFQMGLLRKLGMQQGVGLAQLEEYIHDATFSYREGGSTWAVSQLKSEQAHKKVDDSISDKVLPTSIAHLLSWLNHKQVAWTQQNAQILDTQQHLYLGWCKHMEVLHQLDDAGEDTQAATSSGYLLSGLYNHLFPQMVQNGFLVQKGGMDPKRGPEEILAAAAFKLFIQDDDYAPESPRAIELTKLEESALAQIQELIQLYLYIQYSYDVSKAIAEENQKSKPSRSIIINRLSQLLGIHLIIQQYYKNAEAKGETLLQSISQSVKEDQSKVLEVWKKLLPHSPEEDFNKDDFLQKLREHPSSLTNFSMGELYWEVLQYWKDNDRYDLWTEGFESLIQPVSDWINQQMERAKVIQSSSDAAHGLLRDFANQLARVQLIQDRKKLEKLAAQFPVGKALANEAYQTVYSHTAQLTQALKKVIDALLEQLPLAQQVALLHNALNQTLWAISPNLALKKIPDDYFYTPRTPVVTLIESIKDQSQAFLSPSDRNGKNAITPCRLSQEIISGSADFIFPDFVESNTDETIIQTINLLFKEAAILGDLKLDNGLMYQAVQNYQKAQIQEDDQKIIPLPAASTVFPQLKIDHGTMPYYSSMEYFKDGAPNPFYPLFMVYISKVKMEAMKAENDYGEQAITATYTLEELDDISQVSSSYHADLQYQKDKNPNLETALYEIANYISLSDSSTIPLLHHLEEYVAIHSKNPKMAAVIADLKKTIELLQNKQILSQNLNGFNAQILQRFPTLQLPISHHFEEEDIANPVSRILKKNAENPEEGKESWNAYNPHWNAALPVAGRAPFAPIRAGFAGIKELQIVDCFGQYLRYQFDQNHAYIVSENLRVRDGREAPTYKEDHINYPLNLELPPRFVEATRLRFSFLSADQPLGGDYFEMLHHSPEHTPICAWLLPNHLDNTLVIYNKEGYPLQYWRYQESQKELKTYLIPGPKYPYDQKGILPQFIQRIETLSKGTDFFKKFMAATEYAQKNIHPPKAHMDNSLAPLIGQALAIVRVCLRLEQEGGYSISLDKGALPNQLHPDRSVGASVKLFSPSDFNTPKYDQVKIPLMLGNLPQFDDGLVGYFIEDENGNISESPFYTDANSEDIPGRIIRHNNLTTAIHMGQSLRLCLIIDPRAAIHASTGILPVQEIQLAPEIYDHAIRRLAMYFLIAPVLSPYHVPNQGKRILPTPPIKGFSWKWLEKSQEEGEEIVEKSITYPSSIESLNDIPISEGMYLTPMLLDGWLRLGHQDNMNEQD
ncbi:MAG: hypothetical protein AAFP19_11380 [Bacteroidota bacterium]